LSKQQAAGSKQQATDTNTRGLGAAFKKPVSVFLAFFSWQILTAPGLALATEPSPSPAKRQVGRIIGAGDKKPRIDLVRPRGGWTVGRMVTIEGEISDPTIDPLTVSINGGRYLLRTFDGKFKRAFPVSNGKNTILVRGTNQGGSTEVTRTVFGQVPTVALSATMTSDTDGVYTDLHVYEPEPGAGPDSQPKAHVFWANTASPTGGQFYLNEQGGNFDQPGYGPYLYTHTSPPVGIYRIDANYWPSGDKAHTVATLDVVLFAGTTSEIRRSIKQPLVAPGETATLAYIKIMKGQQGSIFAPGIDRKPAGPSGVWPKWVTEAPPRRPKNQPSGDSEESAGAEDGP
jgi:uncharacterized protein YfaP (DUF2135 family)